MSATNTEITQLPTVWPGWETVEELGEGSFGKVYKIRRDFLGYEEFSAVKCISIPQSSAEIRAMRKSGYDEESITENFREQSRRFLQEYRLMNVLKGHSHIVDCDDLRAVPHDDNIGTDLFIKMELLTPLEEQAPELFTEQEILHLGSDLCIALELCEKNKIIHRDIKPANVFYSKNDKYKLGDFGVSRIMEHSTNGGITGTPRYMAPEVYSNQKYNATADIYSLGLVLYWLLNERRTPFQPLPPAKLSYSIDQEALNRRMSGEPIPAPKNGSAALKQIVLKACAFDPGERYRSAAELREALESVHEQPSPDPKPKPKRKARWLLLLLPLLAAAGVFVLRNGSALTPEQLSLRFSETVTVVNPAGETVLRKQRDEKDDSGYIIKSRFFLPDGTPDYWTEYERDAGGNILRIVNYHADGSMIGSTEFEMDDAARVLAATKYGSDGSVEYRDDYEYDDAGNRVLTLISDANGKLSERIETQYDAAGNRSKTVSTVANGSRCETEYAADGKKSAELLFALDGSLEHWYGYEYDAAGNLFRLTSFKESGNLSYWYEYAYDAENRLAKETHFNADGSRALSLEYDAAGNNIKTTQYNADGSIYEYTYDIAGNKIGETLQNADGSTDHRYGFEYDAAGLKTKQIVYEDDGSRLENEYDTFGHQVRQSAFRADGSLIRWTAYEYDGVGNVVKELYYNADGSLAYWSEYKYASGRRKTGHIVYNADGSTNRRTEYDASGNASLLKLFNADGSSIEYTYNTAGKVIKETQLRADGGSSEYEYNSAGVKTKDTQYKANGSRYEYEYDAEGKPTKETHYSSGGSKDYWAEYEYDKFGKQKRYTVYNADGSTRSVS